MALPIIAAGVLARVGAKKLAKKLAEKNTFKPSVRSLNKLTHRKIDAANAAQRAKIDKYNYAPKPKFDKPTPEMISKAGPVKIIKYKKGK